MTTLPKTLTFSIIIIAFYAVGECYISLNSTFGPALRSAGGSGRLLILYRLDSAGVFHRCGPRSRSRVDAIAHSTPRLVTYSVLKNGVLIPGRGPYPIDYQENSRGDLLPLASNKCVYKSDRAAYYVRGRRRLLTPVQIVPTPSQDGHIVDKAVPTQLQPPRAIVPDTGCNGDVTLFLLTSDGHFNRIPPDEYLPRGMRLNYELAHDGVLTPRGALQPTSHQLTYLTGDKGNLMPSMSNTHTLATFRETSQSFILAEGGLLAPVREALANDSVDYFFDGRLIHSSSQFGRVFSNTSVIYLTEKESSERQLNAMDDGPRFDCSRRVVKRDTEECGGGAAEGDQYAKKPCKHCAFVYDDKGKRISLEPYINEKGRVAIYKLTCKGHLKRLDPYSEPEYGFEVKFKLLDSFILVPTSKKTGRVYLRYTLQDNGNLAPIKGQKFTYKKAPASMLYYILTRNKELVPIRVRILKDSSVEVYYQDCMIYTLEAEQARPMQLFTTLYAPLYVYLNSRLTIIYHDPLPKPETAATWSNIEKTATYPCRNLYLVGPNNVKMKIEIELNKNGVPEIYAMDCKGVCHKSPKDDNKNLVVKSYKLVAEGMILVPTNESNGYMFLVDRQGNMLPYCYPGSKLRAPFGLTVYYVRCKGGILLPVLVEAVTDHVRFSYDSIIVYYKKAYTLDEILEVSVDSDESKSTREDIIYQKEKGDFVYFEKVRKTLFRHPKKKIADYLLGHTAYFNILPSGTLDSNNFLDPKLPHIKIQVQREGDIIILDNQQNVKLEENYLLAKNASLIPVNVSRRDGYLVVYRKGVKITRINYLGGGSNSDPMGLFSSSEAPAKGNSSYCTSEPQQVEIPIADPLPPEKQNVLVIDSKKCAAMRKAIQEMVDKDPSLMGADLEMNDSMVNEIFKLVCNCSSVECPSHLSRRPRSLGDDESGKGCR